jgi:hypothetical protein
VAYAKRKDKKKSHFHKAILKYGPNAFRMELVEEVTADTIDDRERYWIKHHNSFFEGYNGTYGGDGGDTSIHIDYQARKDQSGANNPMYGKSARIGTKHSEETLKVMAEKRRAFWADPEKAAKVKRHCGESNPMFGKTPGNARPFEYEGVVYPSRAACVRAVGKAPQTVMKQGRFIDE